MCRNKMQAASALIDGLSGEKVRWIEQRKEFKSQINRQVKKEMQLNIEMLYSTGGKSLKRLITIIQDWFFKDRFKRF